MNSLIKSKQRIVISISVLLAAYLNPFKGKAVMLLKCWKVDICKNLQTYWFKQINDFLCIFYKSKNSFEDSSSFDKSILAICELKLIKNTRVFIKTNDIYYVPPFFICLNRKLKIFAYLSVDTILFWELAKFKSLTFDTF